MTSLQHTLIYVIYKYPCSVYIIFNWLQHTLFHVVYKYIFSHFHTTSYTTQLLLYQHFTTSHLLLQFY